MGENEVALRVPFFGYFSLFSHGTTCVGHLIDITRRFTVKRYQCNRLYWRSVIVILFGMNDDR
jgi:hypothetical protein